MTLENILDQFYSDNVDYEVIVNNIDLIKDNSDQLLANLNNPNKDPELTIYSLMLLSTIGEKKAFPLFLNLFKTEDIFIEENLADTFSSIAPLVGVDTFDGNYHVLEDTILNNKDNSFISYLFLSYAYICIILNKSSKLVNFIKANLSTELYDGFFDDIIEVYLDYQLDSLTVIVKELNLKHKVSAYNGPYYQILDLYLTENDNIDTSVRALYQNYADYNNVSNIEIKDNEYKFLNTLIKKQDKIEDYIMQNGYKGDIEEYLEKFFNEIKFEELYPLNEIKNELTRVEKDIEIDYMLYKYFITQEVVYDFDDSDSYKFINDYYAYILEVFEKYLEDHNFTNDDYDFSRSIHFITDDIYEE